MGRRKKVATVEDVGKELKLKQKTFSPLITNTLNTICKDSDTTYQIGIEDGAMGVYDQISTGSLALDFAIGPVSKRADGTYSMGVPRGRLTEVFGPESCGKTTLCSHLIASAQMQGLKCAFIDAEHAYDFKYASAQGVSTNDLLVVRPDTGENAVKAVLNLISTGEIGLLILDSIAALIPEAVMKGEIGDRHVATLARLVTDMVNKLPLQLERSNTACVVTNQIREKIGVTFGSPETTPGGRALKHALSVRLDLRRTGSIKTPTGDVTGHTVKGKVAKSKIDNPFRTAEFNIEYGLGIDSVADCMKLATEYSLVQKDSSWITIGDHKVQGLRQLKNLFMEEMDLFDNLRTQVIEHYIMKRKGREYGEAQNITDKECIQDAENPTDNAEKDSTPTEGVAGA